MLIAGTNCLDEKNSIDENKFPNYRLFLLIAVSFSGILLPSFNLPMFRHRQERKLIHNIKLASLLSFVAGLVNAAGFFALDVLTTNITGHFAVFVNGLSDHGLEITFYYGFFVFSFFAGAFFSSFLMEVRALKNSKTIGLTPLLLESAILIVIAFLSDEILHEYPYLIGCFLLFAMGIQNALVTTISRSIVRTTHLTGIFTDLGIELSQLIFYKQNHHQKIIWSSIKLHLSIIISFFVGIVAGGFLYAEEGKMSFFYAALLLIIGLIWRKTMIYFKNVKRHLHH